jgi:hypothetical protein
MTDKKTDQSEPTPFEKFRALAKRVVDAAKPAPPKVKKAQRKQKRNMRGRGS